MPWHLKFADVREDPAIEAALVHQTGSDAVLLVASAGCTALTLAQRFPDVALTVFDWNPLQLAHVQHKSRAAMNGDLRALNVGTDDPRGLNQRGEFEGLFRTLRGFVEEFVAPAADIGAYFRGDLDPSEWLSSPYWEAAFETAFNTPFLHAMFGPAATQHAEPGSYPAYFRRAFERGLRRSDGRHNPFLQHVLLGAYLPEDAPAYVRSRSPASIEAVLGSLPDVPDLSRFGLVSLSNLFDWSDDAHTSACADALGTLRPGAAILIRQLNNQRNLRAFFEPAFTFDDGLGASLWDQDRSLFYNRIEVGFRR